MLNKRKKIVITVIGILILLPLIIFKFNDKKVLKQDGVILALTLDGKSISSYPNYSSGNYTVDVTCNNASGRWIPVMGDTTATFEWKLVIEDISPNAGCNLDFKTKTDDDTLSNLIQNDDVRNVSESGYRYIGKNPNNYVEFNGELWRIIGLIPSSSGGTSMNLVKIIRNEPIAHCSFSNSEWSYGWSIALDVPYSLNNEYYLAGTSDGLLDCAIYSTSNTLGKDYNIGHIAIVPTSHYGKMVKSASSYDGKTSTSSNNPVTLYGYEKTSTTGDTYISFMSSSDYALASSLESSLSTEPALFGDSSTSSDPNPASHDWLFKYGNEWTVTQSWEDYSMHYITDLGNVEDTNVSVPGYIRPTLFLNENVYVVDGTGTATDPYILDM